MNSNEKNTWLQLSDYGHDLSNEEINAIVIGDLIIKLNQKRQFFTSKNAFIQAINGYQDSNHLINYLKKNIEKDIQNVPEQTLFKILNKLTSFSVLELFNLLNYAFSNNLEFKNKFYNNGQITGLDKLVLDLADVQKADKVLDPSCGINGAWLELLKENTKQELVLQEVNQLNAALAYIETKVLKAEKCKVYQGDTITDPKYIKNGELQLFDKVITFPPISLKISKEAVELNKFNRFRYGKIPTKVGDLAFISNAISSLNDKGKAVIITSDGPLFRGGDNEALIQNLVNSDLIETVISLPPRLLSYSTIPIDILIINKNKGSFSGKIQFINAQQDEWVRSTKNGNILTSQGIEKIVYLYQSKSEDSGYSTVVSQNDYQGTLDVKKYILPKSAVINGVTYNIDRRNLKNLSYITLSDLVKVKRGYNVTRRSEDKNGKFRAIKVTDINEDHHVNYDQLSRITIPTDPIRYLVAKNDILLSTRGTIGKAALIVNNHKNLVANANIAILESKDSNIINMKWLMLYLTSPLGQFMIRQVATGTAISTISIKDLGNIKVAKVDIEKQNQIIAEYEKVKRQLDLERKQLLEKYAANDSKLYESMAVDKILRKEN